MEYLLFGTTWSTLFPGAQGKQVRDWLTGKGVYKSGKPRIHGFSQRPFHIIDGSILDEE